MHSLLQFPNQKTADYFKWKAVNTDRILCTIFKLTCDKKGWKKNDASLLQPLRCNLTVWHSYLSWLQSADSVHRYLCEAAASLFWTTGLCRAQYFWKHHFRALLSSCTWERAREFKFSTDMIRKIEQNSILTVAISIWNSNSYNKANVELFHTLEAIDRRASLAHFVSMLF